MRRLHLIFYAGLASASSARLRPFPISNPVCTVSTNPYGTSQICDGSTLAWCSTPEGIQCGGCTPAVPSGGAALTDPPGFFEAPRVEEVVSPEEYLVYKMLEVEYLVEFSNNPMPFQEKRELPYCGLAGGSRRLEKRKCNKNSAFGKLGGCGAIDKGGEALDDLKTVIETLGSGIGSMPIPGLGEPPKYVPRPVCIPKTINVPIHFTVFTANLSTSRIVTPEVIEKQLALTNEAYKPLGISFFFATLNYHVGEEFKSFTQHMQADNPNSTPAYQAKAERIKQQNRYGGNDEVNIWIVESIDTPTCKKRTDGYCTPASWLRDPNHPTDGCVIEIDSLPGVKYRFFGGNGGTGTTLTHEIGHWFNLWHVFPNEDDAGCTGGSDGIADTFQFPNIIPGMFDKRQRRCCATKDGFKTVWDFCPEDQTFHVTNYMSYGEDKGVINLADPDDTKPWTTMQRASMFASYFTMRRAAPGGGLEPSCVNQFVVFEDPAGAPATPATLAKRSGLEINRFLRGVDLLKPSANILETLRRICAAPPGPDRATQAIDAISGEEIKCNADTRVCEPPPSGARCPNGSAPPCSFETGDDPRVIFACPDGTAPPCAPLATVCEKGKSLSCIPNKDLPLPPEVEDPVEVPPVINPPKNGEVPTPGPGDGKNPKAPGIDPGKSSCPIPCAPLKNKCDPTTAPTCIFPDPRLPSPKAFCACAPGWKAVATAEDARGGVQKDTSRQWRLPIVGQEHRVWVPEGQKCDQVCRDIDCSEVGLVGIECAGGEKGKGKERAMGLL